MAQNEPFHENKNNTVLTKIGKVCYNIIISSSKTRFSPQHVNIIFLNIKSRQAHLLLFCVHETRSLKQEKLAKSDDDTKKKIDIYAT